MISTEDFELYQSRVFLSQSDLGGKDYVRLQHYYGCPSWVPEGFILNPPFARLFSNLEELNWPGWGDGIWCRDCPQDIPVEQGVPHCRESLVVSTSSGLATGHRERIKTLRKEFPGILTTEQLFYEESIGGSVWVHDKNGISVSRFSLFHAKNHGYALSIGYIDNELVILAAPVDDYGKTWVATLHSARKFDGKFAL